MLGAVAIFPKISKFPEQFVFSEWAESREWLALKPEVPMFIAISIWLYIYLFIEFVTIQKKITLTNDEDNYVTGERNRTFVPLETLPPYNIHNILFVFTQQYIHYTFVYIYIHIHLFGND
jgi:hypothetical protein